MNQKRRQPSMFGDLANRIQSPGFMGGAVMLDSALQGGGIAQGAQIVQRGRQQKALMDFRNQEAERAQKNSDRQFELAQKRFAQASQPKPVARPWWARDDGSIDAAMKAYRTSGQQGAATRFGLNPIAVQNPDGSIGYVVPNTAGDVKALKLPGGAKAISPASTFQTPTETVTRDRFGNVLRRERHDIAGAESQRVVGAEQGNARIKLPAVEYEAKRTTQYIDKLINHPALKRMTAPLAEYAPTVSAHGRDFNQRLAQVQGKAFVTAFESLKGAGAVTETEGSKAGQALARLQQAEVGTQNFIDAANDFKAELKALVELKRAHARGGVPNVQAAPSGPKAGDGAGWSIRLKGQ